MSKSPLKSKLERLYNHYIYEIVPVPLMTPVEAFVVNAIFLFMISFLAYTVYTHMPSYLINTFGKLRYYLTGINYKYITNIARNELLYAGNATRAILHSIGSVTFVTDGFISASVKSI
ncbi:conserved hypothetical protein [Geotrichum candidum]|uniref:Uncharacterized protein n=1 Tax=Geotrichum candidum TaxID=1173061 RepID=A0A0J9XC29_GEOCN|nr:conserved hypothetical protein [Geotrichum candidum]